MMKVGGFMVKASPLTPMSDNELLHQLLWVSGGKLEDVEIGECFPQEAETSVRSLPNELEPPDAFQL